MNTTQAPDVAVPADLLPIMRERAVGLLAGCGDIMHVLDSHRACNPDGDRAIVDSACEQMEAAIAAYRALTHDRDAYAATAVELVAREVIEWERSRVADDHLDVDEAEETIRRIRRCEALLDELAVTA